MNTKQFVSIFGLAIGLAGSAQAFDTEGDIENSLHASPVAARTTSGEQHVRHPFQSEGDLHDEWFGDRAGRSAPTSAFGNDQRIAFQAEGDLHEQWFGAPAAPAGGIGKAMVTRFAFESEGDLYRQSVAN